MTIEESRALTVAINSLRFNPDLNDIQVQSYEIALANMRNRAQDIEDTELTPEEITSLKSIKSWADAVERELDKYIQAEKAGRLILLPCRPDAIFYQWKVGDDCPSTSRFEGVEISEDGEITYPMKRWGETFTLDDFGKTVFLTREAAEAALNEA